jgi:UDP-hydrolysing UDP-N-acetyl-D-glucosamine 2-epimerase
MVGCPRIDLVAEILKQDGKRLNDKIGKDGVGDQIDLSKPFLLVTQHPVTTEYGAGEDQIMASLQAVRATGMPAIALWPNADAGSDDIARGMRKWRERGLADKMRFFKNLPIDIYTGLMARTACMIGNSSSGIREGAFIGTPVVNVGTRQVARERGQNVIDVPHETQPIQQAILKQVQHGRYEADPIYGDGGAGPRVANILATQSVTIQKRITY